MNEYLRSRGWIPDPGGDQLLDPIDGNWNSFERAIDRQRARDAVEERAAWVQFAAAGMKVAARLICQRDGADVSDVTVQHEAIAEQARNFANAMLVVYRRRFATPEPR